MRDRGFMKMLAGAVALTVLLMTAGAGGAQAWWDGKWQHRKKIVIDTSPQGADIKEAVSDLPLLVRLHSGNFDFGRARNDGSDIRFVAGDDKTPLKYHIEQYDPKAEMGLVWIKVPRLSPGSDKESIWLYYGNEKAAGGQDPGGTYDTPQSVVYHLSEKEGMPRDATAYGNHAKEFTGDRGTAGPIGLGITLKGQTEHLTIGKSASLNTAKGFTFSAWVKSARPGDDARLFSWDDGKQSIVIGIGGGSLYCSAAGPKKSTTAKGPGLPAQKWTHVAVTLDGTKGITIYTDGQERTVQKLDGPLPEPASDAAVGASLQGKNAFAGGLDEVNIAGVARPAAWIRAEAVGQGPETALLNYGEEESSSGGGENLTIHLLVVTAKAITLDGWLIIGLILAMVGITWMLFFNKFGNLRRLKKDNASFAEAFSTADGLGSLKGKEETYSDSALFRAYEAGMEELDRRLGKAETVNGRKTLPGQALTAFRAALDKAALAESKRNTAGLLFFTLSISGGPFMGLFGTVWGVINTFAGVAEAGEANLAAIAPGVASALACTLMGLVLAIPALFQYSYLSGEIKNVAADMNLFLDEFSNRVEEEYGGRA